MKRPTVDWFGQKTTLRNRRKELMNLKMKLTLCPFHRAIKSNLLLNWIINIVLLLNSNRKLPRSINSLHFLTINCKGLTKSMVNYKKLILYWTIKRVNLLSGSIKLISPSDQHKKTSPDWTVNLLQQKANSYQSKTNSHQFKENSPLLKVKSHH